MARKNLSSRKSPRKRPSLADVAEAAGVSKATVSLVLNGRSKELSISDTTRRRVLEKARQVRYQPRVPQIYEQQSRRLLRHISLAFINPTGKSDHEFFASAFLEIARRGRGRLAYPYQRRRTS